MVKLVIFDLDGTVADLREVHFHALNKAIEKFDKKYSISREEHVSIFDGLSTKKKLNLLHKMKGLPLDLIEEISDLKQELTADGIETNLSKDFRLIELFKKLKSLDVKVYMASNAIRRTVISALKKLGLLAFFDQVFSNEDVKNQKPHPEIYLKCMIDAGVSPDETLIVEDSKHGRECAVKSGANVMEVDSPEHLTIDLMMSRIKECYVQKQTPWFAKDSLNVLIPMAGAGSRFAQQGYKLPKPLIDVNGKPMIQTVVENLNIKANYIFVVQQKHFEQYYLGTILPLIAPGCTIVQTNGLTEGAACTTLLAKEFINNDKHLLIANSDQFVEWDSSEFLWHALSNNVDGSILTFEATGNKWSYLKEENGLVTEVAEKKEISNIATVGIYYYNKGSEYVKYTEQMIENKDKINNEYYVCPVYNYYIKDSKKIKHFACEKLWGIGTPEDYLYFLANYRK